MFLLRQFKVVFKNEELWLYVGTIIASIGIISLNIRNLYDTFGETVRHAAFQVSSIITTTGYVTTDFDKWPSFSKTILLILMIFGACAGSTGGGLKCSRVLLLYKSIKRNIKQILNPTRVEKVRMSGQVTEEKTIENTNVYLVIYFSIIIVSIFFVSIDGFSIVTNLSAVLSCVNNIGPGLEAVGPAMNFGSYSFLSKLVLIIDMLIGRLEIFPILILFSKHTWKKV